jgi:F-type H+-transporting ATPase subunit gamma
MPSLKDLQTRISSVKSTQKITRAMQMVAAAKLRRSQERAEAARPYSQRLAGVLSNLAASTKGSPNPPKLLAGTGKDDVHLLIVATADRGLCGGFNSSIVRLAREHISQLTADGKEVKLFLVGKKAHDMLKRQYKEIIVERRDFAEVRDVGFDYAQEVGETVMQMFAEEQFDVCTIFYAAFQSVVTQVPTAQQLIPPTLSEAAEVAEEEAAVPYEYEPDEEQILAKLLPLNLNAQIFHAILENGASEQGARMSAMDNATRNAGDMIDRLTLQFNRTRQAMITTELIEIISGAESL